MAFVPRWFNYRLIGGLVVSACCVHGATAADISLPRKELPPPPQIENPWSYTLTPYAWLTNINGSGTVANQTKNIDVTFVDLMRHSEIPKNLFELAGVFEARNGRFSIFTDVVYQKIGVAEDVSGSRTLSINGIPIAVASGHLDASAKFQMVIAELSAAYEIAKWQSPVMPGVTALDFYAGGRLWWQQATVDLGADLGVAGLGPFGLSRSAGRVIAKSPDIDWVDPLVGVRLRHQFAPGQDVMLRGDVGGFDVGSRFSWQAIGAYNFEFAKTNYGVWSGMLGYKALYADYSQGSGITFYRYNITEHGPILGVNLRF